MNKTIREQLDRVSGLPPYDDNTTTLHIDCKSSNQSAYTVGRMYILQLANYLTNPPAGFMLASQWNKGISPQSEYIRCEVLQIMGKMIRVGAIGFDMANNRDKDDVYESLWLPISGLKIIRYLGA